MLNRIVIAATLFVTGCASVSTTPDSVPEDTGDAPTQLVLMPPQRTGGSEPGQRQQSSIEPSRTEIEKPSAAPLPAPGMGLRQFIERNDDRLLQVYVGMAQMEVERIMALPAGSAWKNPYRRERLQSGERTYDVWFYLTREPRAGRAIADAELMPVILSSGKVVGLGRYPLKKLRRDAVATR